MHKKEKFDKPRQARRVRALARFPLTNVHAKAELMKKSGKPDQAQDYVSRRLQEHANLAARIAGSSLIGALT